MLSLISNSDWNALSSYDRSLILNFTDQQFALLAIYYDGVIYGTLPPNYYGSNSNPSSISRSSNKISLNRTPLEDKVINCLGVATGIYEAAALFDLGGLNAAATSRSAVKILKAVGKRYLGWVGVALTVYNFYDCMK